METRRDVFQAIADPTRRQIINLVARQSMNVNAIVDYFDVSRPAISNHVQILTECGIITIEQIGRERYCKIQPKNLRQVSDWVETFRDLWEEKLDSFEKYLDTLQSKPKPKKNETAKRRRQSNTNTKKNL